MQSSSETSQQPIPLSHGHKARAQRKDGNRIEVEEDKLRKLLAEVVDERVAAKITRLETSINRMVDQIDEVRTGDANDAALRVTTDSTAADLAVASINLPSEDFYCYTCSMLAEKLQVKQHDIVQSIKRLALRGNRQYHDIIKTGIKSEISKWSEATYLKRKEDIIGNECGTLTEQQAS